MPAVTDLTPRVVVLIEDNCDHAAALIAVLELEGYRTHCAPNGAEGLQRVEELMPQLILLDFTLPDMSGADVGKVLRSAQRTSGIPIVMESGMPEWVVRNSFADYDAFLSKPVDLARMLAVMTKLTVTT